MIQERWKFRETCHLKVLSGVIRFSQNKISVDLTNERLILIDSQLREKWFSDLKNLKFDILSIKTRGKRKNVWSIWIFNIENMK